MKMVRNFINDKNWGYYGDRITISGTQSEIKTLWKCFRRNMNKGGEFWTPFEFPKMIPGVKYHITIMPPSNSMHHNCCWVNRFKPLKTEDGRNYPLWQKERDKEKKRLQKYVSMPIIETKPIYGEWKYVIFDLNNRDKTCFYYNQEDDLDLYCAVGIQNPNGEIKNIDLSMVEYNDYVNKVAYVVYDGKIIYLDKTTIKELELSQEDYLSKANKIGYLEALSLEDK